MFGFYFVLREGCEALTDQPKAQGFVFIFGIEAM